MSITKIRRLAFERMLIAIDNSNIVECRACKTVWLDARTLAYNLRQNAIAEAERLFDRLPNEYTTGRTSNVVKAIEAAGVK